MAVRPTSNAPTQWPMPPTSRPSYATTLPANPYDGQEAILVDSLSNPSYQWRFRYNAASTSAYKWEFIGGSPWMILPLSYTPAGANAHYDDMAAGSILTLPRAGDYILSTGAGLNANSNGVYLGFSYDHNTRVGQQPTSSEGSIFLQIRVTFSAAGQQVGNTFFCSNTATLFQRRTLSAQPIRVS